MMLATIFTLAALTVPAPAEGAYSYALSVAGVPAGKTTVTLAHMAEGLRLTESAAATYGGANFAGTATLDLNGVLAPERYIAVYNAPGRAIHASLTFNGNTANEADDNGSIAFPLAPKTKYFAVLDGTLFAGFFILPAQLRAWNAPAVTAISPMFGHGGLVAVDSALQSDRPKDLAAGDVPISVSDPIAFTIWYDPATLVVDRLVVPSQDAIYSRLPAR